jgi:hypothetical protein
MKVTVVVRVAITLLELPGIAIKRKKNREEEGTALKHL